MADPLVCYTAGYNFVSSSNQWFPCGASTLNGAAAQSCCMAEDYCMEDSICHYTHGGVVNGTGYYMAGCTDSTWQDPSCPKQCTSEYGANIIYDKAHQEWKCCQGTEDSLNCQEPSEFVVEGPNPTDLATIIQLTTPAPSSAAVTGVSSISSSSTAPASVGASSSLASSRPKHTHAHNAHSSAPAHPSSSSSSSSNSLPIGVTAGIAVAVVVGMALLFGGAFLFYRRSKNRHRAFQTFPSPEPTPHLQQDQNRFISGSEYRSSAYTKRSRASLASNKTNHTTHTQFTYHTEPMPGHDGLQPIPMPLPSPQYSGAQSRGSTEKYSYEHEQEVQPAGPFEMSGSGGGKQAYEMQQRQELEGTSVVPVELDAVHLHRRSDATSIRDLRMSVDADGASSRRTSTSSYAAASVGSSRRSSSSSRRAGVGS